MQIIVTLRDVIIDPAKPVDLTAMPAERAIELLRKAYGFLAANMTFEIRDEKVVITVDYERRQDEATAKDCFDRGMKTGLPNAHVAAGHGRCVAGGGVRLRASLSALCREDPGSLPSAAVGGASLQGDDSST